jgi:UDP-glucose 4-epimerase
VLVTGGAGFIGSHVADRLLAMGFPVTVLDDLSRGKRERVPAGAEFIQLDVRAPAARSLVASGRFRTLIHLAAQADVRVSVGDPAHDAGVNLIGLLNLLSGAAAGGIRRVVFASSGGVVYGAAEALPTPETAPKQPSSPYGVSKLAGEHYLRVLGGLGGYEIVALRYANVYGPRQDPHGEAGVVAIFLGRLLAGQPLTVFGDGRQTRDYVHVDDVARATVAALAADVRPGGGPDEVALNIGTGVETSVLDLIGALERATGRKAEVHFAAERPGELRRNALVIERAKAVLDWAPQWTLEAGLRDLADNFQPAGS